MKPFKRAGAASAELFTAPYSGISHASVFRQTQEMSITARHPSQYHINKLACGNLREASAVSSRIAEEVSVDHRTRIMTPTPRPFLPPFLHQTSFRATPTMTCISPARSQIRHQRRRKQTATVASPMLLNGEVLYRFCTCIMSRYPESLDGHKRLQDRIQMPLPRTPALGPIRLATAGSPGTRLLVLHTVMRSAVA
jgi:hypothetical protein